VLGAAEARPPRVANAGCTTSLGRLRLFSHRDGQLTGQGWLDHGARRPVERPAAEREAA
jgi:hypothetical protein